MVISIINQKGGTGKTTTAINLGRALVLNHQKVLLIDIDPQGNLTYSLSIPDDVNGLSEVMMGEVILEEVLVKKEGLDVLPSNLLLADIELTLHQVEERERILDKMIRKVREKYDYILIDCPPSLSLLTVNALTTSDKVIIPILLDVLSLQGLRQIVGTMDKIKNAFNEHLQLMGVLAVNVDERKKISKEIMDLIHNDFQAPMFDNYIRTNVKAAEAPSFGTSVIDYAPKSNSAIDYCKLAKEILGINKN